MLQTSHVAIVVGVLWIFAPGVHSRGKIVWVPVLVTKRGFIFKGLHDYFAIHADCSATIIGPLLEGEHRDAFIQNANDTQPAVAHCRVNCEDPGGSYVAAMGIILTEFGNFTQTRIGDTEDGLYTITFEEIQICTPSNNYTMEFRYEFYPLSAKMNKTILTCGIVYTAPRSEAPCWGQSYLIINYVYTAVSPSSTTSLPHTASPTTTPTPMPSSPINASPTTSLVDSETMVTTPMKSVSVMPVTGPCTDDDNGDEPSVDSQVQPAAVYAPGLVLGVALVVAILIIIIEGVIIAFIHPKNRVGSQPQKDTSKKDIPDTSKDMVIANESESKQL